MIECDSPSSYMMLHRTAAAAAAAAVAVAVEAAVVAHESGVDEHHGRSRFMDSSNSVRAQLLFDVVLYRKENTRTSSAQIR